MGVNIYVAGSVFGDKAVHKPGIDSKSKNFIYYSLMVLIVASGIFLLTWKEIYGMKIGYDIQQKEERIKELTSENRMYKMQLMNLASLEKIEKNALEEMDFQKPLVSQIRIVE